MILENPASNQDIPDVVQIVGERLGMSSVGLNRAILVSMNKATIWHNPDKSVQVTNMPTIAICEIIRSLQGD